MKPVKDLPEGLSRRVSGTRYLWCEECHRTFTEDDVVVDDATFDKATMYAGGSPNLDRLGEAVMMRARCAYPDCNVPLRTRLWSTMRARVGDLPEVPEAGVRYEEPEDAPEAAVAETGQTGSVASEGSC